VACLCTHVIQGHSQLLLVENQIDTLIFNFFFGQNLCLYYWNGSDEPIFNIYTSIIFQRYKEIFSVMNFDPWNISLKIQDSMGLPIPKMKVHLGVCGFIPYILGSENVTPVLHFWLTHFHAFALVMSSGLKSWHHYFCLFRGIGLPLMVRLVAPAFVGYWALITFALVFCFHKDDHFTFLHALVHVKTNTYPYQVTLQITRAMLLEVI